MRIITWNVNGIRAVHKKDAFGPVLDLKPDMLCLQETKAEHTELDEKFHKLYGNESHWSSCQTRKGYCGVVTYANAEVVESHEGFGVEEFDREGRVIVTQHPEFTLYNIYFPNGAASDERREYKERFNDALFEHLQEKLDAGESLVVVGDYNIAHTEMDIYDPEKYEDESGFLPAEREWLTEFLEMGFVDGFRYLHPEQEDTYTWWSYRKMARLPNRGWRIDYICVSEDLAERITNCEILDKIEGSDHCPVLLDLGE